MDVIHESRVMTPLHGAMGADKLSQPVKGLHIQDQVMHKTANSVHANAAPNTGG